MARVFIVCLRQTPKEAEAAYWGSVWLGWRQLCKLACAFSLGFLGNDVRDFKVATIEPQCRNI